MEPTSRRPLVCAVLTFALLTGCDAGEVLGSDDPADPVDDSSSAATEPSDVLPEGTLAVGETFDGAVSTTVTAIVRGNGNGSWLPSGAGFEWLATTVRSCLSAGGSPMEVGWYQWAATDADGGWYPADLDYDGDQPSGQYPRLVDLAPGECVEGRVLIAVPRAAEVVAVVNADESGAPQGSWLVSANGGPAATDGE